VPSDDGAATGLLLLAGLTAAAGTLLYIGRRRSSEQR
jgi:hypothetical protein